MKREPMSQFEVHSAIIQWIVIALVIALIIIFNDISIAFKELAGM